MAEVDGLALWSAAATGVCSVTQNTEWLRLLLKLSVVAALLRLALPRRSVSIAASTVV